MNSAIKKNGQSQGRQLVVIATTGVVAVLLFWQYSLAIADGLGWHEASEFQVIAPDFEADDPAKAKKIGDFVLKDRFGRKVALSQFDSVDLLMVNIWSSSCPICREEVPELTEMDRRIGGLGKAALLTIAVEDKFEDVASYFPKGTDLRILFDPDDKIAGGVFGTKKYPETFVLDKKRRIRARFDGKRPWHSDTMMNYLSKFL